MNKSCSFFFFVFFLLLLLLLFLHIFKSNFIQHSYVFRFISTSFSETNSNFGQLVRKLHPFYIEEVLFCFYTKPGGPLDQSFVLGRRKLHYKIVPVSAGCYIED